MSSCFFPYFCAPIGWYKMEHFICNHHALCHITLNYYGQSKIIICQSLSDNLDISHESRLLKYPESPECFISTPRTHLEYYTEIIAFITHFEFWPCHRICYWCFWFWERFYIILLKQSIYYDSKTVEVFAKIKNLQS